MILNRDVIAFKHWVHELGPEERENLDFEKFIYIVNNRNKDCMHCQVMDQVMKRLGEERMRALLTVVRIGSLGVGGV